MRRDLRRHVRKLWKPQVRESLISLDFTGFSMCPARVYED
jgi:hypothetical protein